MTKNTSAPTFHEQTDGQSQAHKFFLYILLLMDVRKQKKKKSKTKMLMIPLIPICLVFQEGLHDQCK